MTTFSTVPPPVFLSCLSKLLMSVINEFHMFENYIHAVNEDDLPDSRKQTLLAHCLATEGIHFRQPFILRIVFVLLQLVKAFWGLI